MSGLTSAATGKQFFSRLLALALIAACPLAGFAQAAIEKDPGYLPIDKMLDLKANPPQVNVNLPRFLLNDVLSNLSSSNSLIKSKDHSAGGAVSGAEIADLLKDVKLIRVVVFEGKKSSKTDLGEGVKKLQTEVDSKWTSIVRVHDGGDNVGVYTIGDPAGESMAGLAVLVHSGDGDTVIVNVVGSVSIGKLMQIASKSNKLPKDLLKQFGLAGEPGALPAARTKKTAAVTTTNAPIEAPQGVPKDSDKK